MHNSAALSKKNAFWYAKNYYGVEDDIFPVFEKLDTPFLDALLLKKDTPNSKPRHLFDAMMGRGRHAVRYAVKGLRVWGNDYNKHMVRIVKKSKTRFRLSSKQLRLTNYDVTSLPIPDDSFDVSIAMFSAVGTIPKSRKRQMALNEMARVTKPGGIVIIHAHNRLDCFLKPEFFPWLFFSYKDYYFRREKNFEIGDMVTSYNGLHDMFNHFYSPSEFKKSFKKAGLHVVQEEYMEYAQKRFLRSPLKKLLADGFIFVGRKR